MSFRNFLERLEGDRERELAAALALLSLNGIGPSRLKRWTTLVGQLSALWCGDRPARMKGWPQGGEVDMEVIKKIQNELEFIHKFQLGFCMWGEADYPQRLKNCPDAPYILFFKGREKLEHERHVAVVGTRNASEKARRFTLELIAGLAPYRPLIVSGLALGIDTAAHRAALDVGLPTAAVVGHGLDRIYPAANRDLAAEIVKQGYLLTEFPSGTLPDKQNFPRRNRIVAGLADAVVVVETSEEGGAMITAQMALTYQKEVFSVPGRPWENQARGCNILIKNRIAELLTGPEDLIEALNWDTLFFKSTTDRQNHQLSLTPEEEEVVSLLGQCSPCHLEELGQRTHLSPASLASALLSLEINGIIRALPGRQYELA